MSSNLPAFMFYPGDWRKDSNLQACSIFARGLLTDLLCLMHEANERGRLAWGDGSAWTDEEICGAIAGPDLMDAKISALKELMRKNVLRRDDQGVIYSSRMVKDEDIRRKRADAGTRGGLAKAKQNRSKIPSKRLAKAKQIPEYENEDENEDELFLLSSSKKGKASNEQEVEAYCKSLDLPKSDAEYLWNKWEGNGWTNGKDKIKDWKATVRSWKAAKYLPSQKQQSSNQSQPRLSFAEQAERRKAEEKERSIADEWANAGPQGHARRTNRS